MESPQAKGSFSSLKIRRSTRRRRAFHRGASSSYGFMLLLLFQVASSSRTEPVQSTGFRKEVGEHQSSSEESSSIVSSRVLLQSSQVDFKTRPDHGSNSDSDDESRRDLSGLGSSPPLCNSKCGYCTPCRAVHVPIQPGFVRTTEYYPEAWRCKCGSKLYMP